MEMILRESDPQTYPSNVELLPIVDRLPEDVVVLGHLLLVDLPGEVRGRVGGFTAAVELQQVSNLVLLHVEICRDGRGLVGQFCNQYFSISVCGGWTGLVTYHCHLLIFLRDLVLGGGDLTSVDPARPEVHFLQHNL